MATFAARTDGKNHTITLIIHPLSLEVNTHRQDN